MPDATPSPTQRLIAQLWQRNQPQVLERLALLDHAAAAADSSTLTPQLQQDAAAIAHKLAGSLGMFGFPEGTRIARELEQLLESPNPTNLQPLAAQLRQTLFPST